MNVNRFVTLAGSVAVILMLSAGPTLAHGGTIVLTKNGEVVASDGHATDAAETTWSFTWTSTGKVKRLGLNVYLHDSDPANGQCDGTQVYHNPSVDPNGPQPLAVTTPGPGQHCVNAFMVGASSHTKVTVTVEHAP